MKIQKKRKNDEKVKKNLTKKQSRMKKNKIWKIQIKLFKEKNDLKYCEPKEKKNWVRNRTWLTSSSNAEPEFEYYSTEIASKPGFIRTVDGDGAWFAGLVPFLDQNGVVAKNPHDLRQSDPYIIMFVAGQHISSPS